MKMYALIKILIFQSRHFSFLQGNSKKTERLATVARRLVFQSPFFEQTVRSTESRIVEISASIQCFFELVKYVLGKDHIAGIQKRTDRNPKIVHQISSVFLQTLITSKLYRCPCFPLFYMFKGKEVCLQFIQYIANPSWVQLWAPFSLNPHELRSNHVNQVLWKTIGFRTIFFGN